MKIFKSPDSIFFDTDNPNVMEFKPVPTTTFPFPLHNLVHSESDYLLEYFKPVGGKTHPIFNNFGQSFFWVEQPF